ncbi:AAA family ATPase [Chloroflexota bacterium]
MKEYTEFIMDAYEQQANRPRFIINQLMPNSSADFGVIAGRWWLGKTNICLEMIFCLATGDPFFGFQVDPVPVVFLDFDGNHVNVSERILKISSRHSTPPDSYLYIQNLKDSRFKLHGNIDKLVNEVKGAKVAVIDGTKHLIEGEYIKPSVIKTFGEDLLKAMQKGNFTAVVTWQVRKPHQNTLITPVICLK